MTDETPEVLTLAEVLRMAITNQMVDVHTAMPGHVVRVGGSKVDIQLDLQRVTVEGGSITIPVLKDVPVLHPRSGNGSAYLQMPLSVGDTGLVVFCERNLDDWKDDGKIGPPSNLDDRYFHYSDGIFIPGLFPFNKELNATNSVILKNKDSVVELTNNGKISIGNTNAELLTIINDLLDILQQLTVVTAVGIGTISPETLIKIQQQQLLLKTIKK